MKAKRALDMYKKGQTVPPTLMQGLMPIIDMIDEIMSSNLANVRFLQMVDKRARKQLGIKESVLKEGEMESAELVLASKDMVDRIQSMLEDVSEMQAEDLLPLTDQIRDEMGNEKAEAEPTEEAPEEEATDDVEVDLDAGPEGQEGVDDLDRQERP